MTVTLNIYSHLSDEDCELIANSMNNRYDRSTRQKD